MSSTFVQPTFLANSTLPFPLPQGYYSVATISKTSGILSLVVWLFAQLPQVFENYLNHSVSGVSTSFLICWISGDFTNLVGCLLTRALPFQVCLAAYYCFIDLILALQFWYYTKVYPNQIVHHNMLQSPNMMRPVHSNDAPNPLLVTRSNRFEASPNNYPINQRSSSSSDRRSRQPRRSFIKKVLSGSVISSTFKRVSGSHTHAQELQDPSNSTKSLLTSLWHSFKSLVSHIHYNPALFGVLSGWTSTCFYLTSRLPQILKNYRSKSTKGISPLMFTFALLGNSFYTLSILSDLYLLSKYDQYLGDYDFQNILNSQLPFMIGSAGTVLSDAIILVQFWIYRERPHGRDSRRNKTPLQRALDFSAPHDADDHFTKPEWYTNVYGNSDSRENDHPFGNSLTDSHNGSSHLRKSYQETPIVYQPDESSSLLHNSYLATPPSHYVSSLNRKTVQNTKHRRGISDTFNAMARSFSKTSDIRSPSIASSNGSVTAPGTSLIPSIVGTYSSLSKRMLDDSKVPFSPIDFLHTDFLHQNDGSSANNDF